jgi:hypothetical protein
VPGNALIAQVTSQLRREFPGLDTFATLPVPGFVPGWQPLRGPTRDTRARGGRRLTRVPRTVRLVRKPRHVGGTGAAARAAVRVLLAPRQARRQPR